VWDLQQKGVENKKSNTGTTLSTVSVHKEWWSLSGWGERHDLPVFAAPLFPCLTLM